MASHSPDLDDSVEELSGDQTPQNLFGLQSEAPSFASSLSSAGDGPPGAGPVKIWSDHEIVSKLQSGDLKEIENTKSKKEFWKKFTEITDKKGAKIGFAKCKGCKNFMKYSGQNGTSALSRHKCNQSTAISNTHPITGYFPKQSTTNVSSAAKTQFGKAVAYFCAKDMRPFASVDGKGFRKLISETLDIGSVHGLLHVDNLIPDEKTVKTHVATIAADNRKKLKNQLQPVFLQCGLAVTLDFWTDDYRKNPYLAITGHFIDENWELQDTLIGVFPWDVNLRQTYETIPTFLYEKLDGFGLTARQKIIFVTDEGSNLKKALENEHRLNCTAHVLNTALKNVFDKESKLPVGQISEILPALDALEACKSLVTFIRQSRIKAQLSKKVVPDVDTRWHSKVDMIESVLNSWEEIEDILTERDRELKKNDLERLNNIDKIDLERLFRIIEPFRKAILQMETSSKYPTLPLVLPAYQTLLKSLSPIEGEERWVELLKKKLLDSVQKKLLICQDHRIASILHPSYKKLEMKCVGDLDKRRAYNAIRDMMAADASTSGIESDVSTEPESILNPKRPRIAADEFLDDFCTPDSTNSNDELDQYLSAPLTKISVAAVLGWWKMSSSTYPKLSAIARKYLAIPATSAASESAFRYAGLTVTELRNSLNPDTVSDLLFVRHFDDSNQTDDK